MELQRFNEVVAKRIEDINKSLVEKGAEYTRGDDRLHNFKRGGEFRKKDPAVVLWDYLGKQLVSLNDMIDDIEKGRDLMPLSLYKEKIKDVVNYSILLEAILEEKFKGNEIAENSLFNEVAKTVPRETGETPVAQAASIKEFHGVLVTKMK